MEEGRTSGDAAAEALGDSGRGLEDSAAPVDRGEPDLPFVLDRDGGRHTQPEQGQLLGKIETVTAKSDGGGHAVIGRKSGMVLARGETREAADQAARRLAAQLGRRRLQARIDAEPARPQEQLREQLQERDPEASLGEFRG